MNATLESHVRRAITDSEFLSPLRSIRQDGGLMYALGGATLRALFKPEIEVLESLGNIARDWSTVRVADGFNPRRVRDCEFHGSVVLGRFTKYVTLADGLEVISGLTRSTLADCVVGHNALVRDARLLANYVVGEEAVIVDCGRITGRVGMEFGNGTRVPVALEGGGREVEIFAEIDVNLAALVVKPGARRTELEAYRRAVADYRASANSDRGVIGPGARIWGVQRIEDTFVGPAARVDGAMEVVRSTLLSTPEEPVLVESGSLISDSILQWGSRVVGGAVVERSVLVEHARVLRHGKVQNSIVGPNSEVAAGEVSSCLLGPFVMCPHQSLLISTYWPAGRGNVGYGANVGSNHTSRAPDQEFRAAEGLFLGLGVNVKFPCDFSEAPYTVIACGVDLPPQKVSLPFSLITQPKDYSADEQYPGVPPRLNRICPGWMLYENIYALKRNEAKFRARNRSSRHQFDFAVLRRSTVECMRVASRALALPPQGKEFYTSKDIPAIGKNVLTERDRSRAVEAYRFYTLYFALTGLKNHLQTSMAKNEDIPSLLVRMSDNPEWEYQRQIVINDHGMDDPIAGLHLLQSMAVGIAKNCERTRRKDEVRGSAIIDDYAEVHPSAEQDRVVRHAWEQADQIQEEIDNILTALSLSLTGREKLDVVQLTRDTVTRS